VLWVGAAPGNAGGLGAGDLGAHGTRIPFGGDVAGANLEVLLSSIGLTRNETFIVAALNHLPARGGGEPAVAEIFAPEGGYDTSIDLLRDTLLATGPEMIVALGNVAARAVAAAWRNAQGSRRLPSLAALRQGGWDRGRTIALEALGPAAPSLEEQWSRLWKERATPVALWLMHPSAQNMSPFAGEETAFHQRMTEARDTLRAAVRHHLGWSVPRRRSAVPSDGIYALPEWRDRIRVRAESLDRMWREKGI